jgi:hypothetical protein
VTPTSAPVMSFQDFLNREGSTGGR